MASGAETSTHRQYLLQSEVLPAVAQGLEELTHALVQERKRVLRGVDWENGYLPDDWENVKPVKWLGEYLLKKVADERSAKEQAAAQALALCRDTHAMLTAATQQQQQQQEEEEAEEAEDQPQDEAQEGQQEGA